MNNKIVYIVIVIVILIIAANNLKIIKNIITTFDIYFIFKSPCDGKLFLDNKKNKLNPLLWERPEQYFITKYVKSTDCVIELGGRYGISSYCIQNKLKNKKTHLVVEPDKAVISALYKNIDKNSMKCTVFNGIISKNNKCFKQDGLGSFTYNCTQSDIEYKSITDAELDGNFNVMVIDCEGCFIDIFNTFKNYILQNITKIIIENDRLNHNKIFDILIKNNFKIVENYFNHIFVFIKTDNTKLHRLVETII